MKIIDGHFAFVLLSRRLVFAHRHNVIFDNLLQLLGESVVHVTNNSQVLAHVVQKRRTLKNICDNFLVHIQIEIGRVSI